MYAEAKEYLDAVKDAQITGHEYLSGKLVKTVFSNGVSVYVNYADQPAEFNGTVIPANGFVYQ